MTAGSSQGSGTGPTRRGMPVSLGRGCDLHALRWSARLLQNRGRPHAASCVHELCSNVWI